MPAFICQACGTQFAPSEQPPPACPVCDDERQYVPHDTGQRWTTLEDLGREHHNRVAPEHDLTAVGTEPRFAIGQRALVVPWGTRCLLWDCVTLVDDATAAAVGALQAIAISHPHYYSGMVEWAHRFGCPVYLHADDARWIMRPDPAVELWHGERKELGDGLTLVRLGGHFAGGTVLHWAGGAGGRGALLSGDIVQVVPDRTHVAFMYSYPNLIPLPVATVGRMAAALEPYAFEDLYGAWWDSVIAGGAKDVVRRSALRYARAIEG